jgi:hypothetical protein
MGSDSGNREPWSAVVQVSPHPCPDEVYGDQLGRLIDHCESLAAAVAQSVNDPATVSFDDLASKIRALGTGTVAFLNRLDP